MRKTFCDKCGDEITTDVTMAFNHELCSECAKAVDVFITHPTIPATMDEVRDFCENLSENCGECPFYDEASWDECIFSKSPCYWPREEETFLKLLDYKVKHPDWRKE